MHISSCTSGSHHSSHSLLHISSCTSGNQNLVGSHCWYLQHTASCTSGSHQHTASCTSGSPHLGYQNLLQAVQQDLHQYLVGSPNLARNTASCTFDSQSLAGSQSLALQHTASCTAGSWNLAE